MGYISNGIIAHLIIQIFMYFYNKLNRNTDFKLKLMFYEHRVFHVQVIYLLTKWMLLYYCFISSSSSF